MPGSWEIKAERDRRVLLAIIMPPDLTCTMNFAQARRNIQLPPGSQVRAISGLPFGPARNQAAKQAVEEGFGALAFMDAVVVVWPDAYMKLLGSGFDLVSGLYYQRFPPLLPCFFNLALNEKKEAVRVNITGWQPGDIVPATFVPAGLLLIRRRVLELAFQHFGGTPFFWGLDTAPLPDPAGGIAPTFSEDFNFSFKCQDRLRIQPMVMTSVVGIHESWGTVGPRWMLPMPELDPLYGVAGVG